MPLHVADTPHGLELRVTGAVLVEVPELALLQQVLATTVSGELVSHPAEERDQHRNILTFALLTFLLIITFSNVCYEFHSLQ